MKVISVTWLNIKRRHKIEDRVLMTSLGWKYWNSVYPKERHFKGVPRKVGTLIEKIDYFTETDGRTIEIDGLTVKGTSKKFFQPFIEERPIVYFFHERSQQTTKFLDIGCGSGFYSVLASCNGNKVKAIDAEEREDLFNNLEINSVQNSVDFEKGFLPADFDINSLFNENFDIVKVDIEGWELELFQALDREHLPSRIELMVEVHSSNFISSGDKEDVMLRLRDLGFETVNSWRRRGEEIFWLKNY